MRKCCNDCIYSKSITLSDRINGYKVDGVIYIDKYLIPDGDDKVICVLRKDVHKRNKEQRKCNLFDKKF